MLHKYEKTEISAISLAKYYSKYQKTATKDSRLSYFRAKMILRYVFLIVDLPYISYLLTKHMDGTISTVTKCN